MDRVSASASLERSIDEIVRVLTEVIEDTDSAFVDSYKAARHLNVAAHGRRVTLTRLHGLRTPDTEEVNGVRAQRGISLGHSRVVPPKSRRCPRRALGVINRLP